MLTLKVPAENKAEIDPLLKQEKMKSKGTEIKAYNKMKTAENQTQ